MPRKTWKGILKGCDCIKKGMKWRIGDGSMVKIYKDNWLTGPRQGEVLSPLGDLPSDALV